MTKKWRDESRNAFLARCRIHRDKVATKKALREKEDREMLKRVERTMQQNLRDLERTQAELTAQRSTLWAPPRSRWYTNAASGNGVDVAHWIQAGGEKTAAVKLHEQIAVEHRRSPSPDLKKALPATPTLP